jgi:indolepyruvate ferredoxin oxidoreductase
MEGRQVLSYDQTGAAQKWGPVLSRLAILPGAADAASNRVGLGKADLYLAFDLVSGAAPANLDRCDPQRTASVVVTDVMPTGEMTRNVHFRLPTDRMHAAIAQHVRASDTVSIGARFIADRLFGDSMMTNVVALAAAYQAGFLPLSADSIEEAIRLNGVQVDVNLQAFRYGRLDVLSPSRVRSLVEPPSASFSLERARRRASPPLGKRLAYDVLLHNAAWLDEEVQRLLAVRIAELFQYKSPEYAARYLAEVLDVARRERQVLGREASSITTLVARNLYKLMAYKDEYEVARLLVDEAQRFQMASLFEHPRSYSYNLHPPLLRALGLKQKLRLGPWFDPVLKALSSARGLRGTPLDSFGYAHVRRVERRMTDWYLDLLRYSLLHLSRENASIVREVANLPDIVRGYDDIKLGTIRTAETRANELMSKLRAESQGAVVRPVRVA